MLILFRQEEIWRTRHEEETLHKKEMLQSGNRNHLKKTQTPLHTTAEELEVKGELKINVI